MLFIDPDRKIFMYLRRRKGRPPIAKRITFDYRPREFYVQNAIESVIVSFYELEAMRLVDYEGLDLRATADRMGVSKSTVWRLLLSGRKKVVDALIHGKRIIVKEGGH